MNSPNERGGEESQPRRETRRRPDLIENQWIEEEEDDLTWRIHPIPLLLLHPHRLDRYGNTELLFPQERSMHRYSFWFEVHPSIERLHELMMKCGEDRRRKELRTGRWQYRLWVSYLYLNDEVQIDILSVIKEGIRWTENLLYQINERRWWKIERMRMRRREIEESISLLLNASRYGELKRSNGCVE